MKPVLSLSLLCAVLVAAASSVSADTPRERGRIVLAQNTTDEKNGAAKAAEESDLTPLPPPKYSITTEKPVKGIIGEKKAVMVLPDSTGAGTEAASAGGPGGTLPTIKAQGVPGAAPVAVPIGKPSASGTDTTKTSGESVKLSNDSSGVPPDINEVMARQRPREQIPKFLMQELSLLNVPTGNLRTVKFVIDDLYNLRGMVYGEEQGYIRILSATDNGDFKETWKSPPFNSPIRGVFLDDLDGDLKSEIIAYTADGNFAIYSYDTHELLYKTPEGTYQNINCMVIHNMDSDPQKELFFIGVKPGSGGAGQGTPAGNLIQFDTVSRFEEWTSTDLYTATDMMIGNVDTDTDEEIVLNTGEILSKQFKDVEWKSSIQLGTRIYLIDMDNDGILELVTEYAETYVKIIDVDQRREKW